MVFETNQLLKRLVQITDNKVLVATESDQESSLILIDHSGNKFKVISERKF